MEGRNLTAHAYDEQTAKEIEKLIHENYYKLFKELHHTLNGKNEK